MAEKPEDFNMPSNVVARIIKDALPNGINVSPDVRSACSRCASIFILYVTTSANNIALSHKRKTLTAPDIIEAIEQIGFEEFGNELKKFQNDIKREKVMKQMAKKSANDSNQSISSQSCEQLEDEEIEEVEAEEEDIVISDDEN